MRNLVLWVGLAAVLLYVNLIIIEKEKTLAAGELMLLELAPVGPRSLLQGDFMMLRYQIANQVLRGAEIVATGGKLVVTLNEQNVARFIRLHAPGTPLAENERLLRFRRRGRNVRIAGDAFFFKKVTAFIIKTRTMASCVWMLRAKPC